MTRLLIASAALLLWATAAPAQNLQETQAPIPLGGTDARALPDRALLPPMFGTNLFSRLADVSVQPATGMQSNANGAQKGLPGAAGAASGLAGLSSLLGGASSLGSLSSASGGASSTSGGASTLGGASSTPGEASSAPGAPGGGNQGEAVAALAALAGQQQTNAIPGTSVQPPPGLAAYDPYHVVAPGDSVQVHIYGATTLDQQATVDSNGDIFLPSVGPVHVAGTLAENLQSAVASGVSSVYQRNAQVYATLSVAVPVDVFVTGAVVAPGQYAQPSTTSVIKYLQLANGIDPKRGSYRDIQILRDGKPIADVDLYDFLLRGQLPPVRLQERDTVLVKQQGPTVAALGDVSGVYRYELTKPETGAQLIALARPYPDATRVTLTGIRDGRPANSTYSIRQFRDVALDDGDIARFLPDAPTDVMTIRLDGRIDGPTTMVVKRQATLFDILPYVPIDPYFSDTSSIYVRRVSVAEAQKSAIDDAMERLKATVVTSPTITAEQAQMQQQEAQVIFQFASELTNVTPEGRLIVEHDGRLQNVRLEDGDVIVVPSRTDLVLVSGEVRVPQAAVWINGAKLEHYINAAGGYTERANESEPLVIRASGETLVGSNTSILPGDRVIVLPAPSNWTLPAIKDITQILYQIAVTAGVALDFNK